MSYQDKAQNMVSQLDKELSKYPALNNLEKQTGVPKVYVVGGVSFFYFFLIFLNYGGQFFTNLAGFVIPGYYSFNALFTVSRTDDAQWLTYWIVFAFLSLIESAVSVTYWLPFYYAFKFVLVLWLGLPQFSGAQVVFTSFLKPLLAKQFSSAHSASAGLRAKVDSLGGDKSL
ncbi:TB2/DP1, HVA22 family-domain-containing protein [Tricharina praecox]|uniref:TB2/DP1, HVA22 family-domain-containing protein n=1 Tax=Tricharina praecox TaxID=43433 RepID=UPI00221F142E|nr:TB2/DP1, HVA22 family-domain-containing protein [Tricharina praecox]KAI5854786.1 TB2/DP1, HVA22 family-domain-containing protein [Tricharina praecox]